MMYGSMLFNQNYAYSPMGYGFMNQWGGAIILFLIWSFIWKGLALWKAAKKESKGWFIVFLLVNTLGILEILYIYIFSKSAKKKGRK